MLNSMYGISASLYYVGSLYGLKDRVLHGARERGVGTGVRGSGARDELF
jgi:hypothetical protein